MKSLFERARDYRHGVLEAVLVARADDLNRPPYRWRNIRRIKISIRRFAL